MEAGRGVEAVVQRGPELAQPVEPHQLVGRQLGSQHRHRCEAVLDGREVLGVRLLPRLEPRVGDRVRQEAVGDHRVDAVAEQRQVRVGAARFRDHHALGVDDQPHAGAGRVGEELAHAVEAVVEPAGGGEHLVARDRQRGHPAEQGAGHAHHLAFHREDALHVPRQDVGQREEADGLRGGRAVDDDHVPVVRRRVGLDVGEGEDLVETRDDRQLFGLEAVHPRPGEHLAEVRLDVLPGLLHPLLRVELLAPQTVRDRRAGGRERHVERVGQRVGRVGGQHHRAQAGVGAAQCGGRGRSRLAHPTLAGEEQDARAAPRGRAQPSTRFFSSSRAVPMILPSARRFTKPGRGTTRSTVSSYVTSVAPLRGSNT